MPHSLTYDITIVAVTIIVSILFYNLIFYFIKRWAKHEKYILPGLLSTHIYYPGLFFFLLIALWLLLTLFTAHLSLKWYTIIRHIVLILLISSTGIFLIRVITVMRELGINHYSVKQSGYGLRKARTKFELIQKVINTMVILTTIAAILMTFNNVRQIGTTLLASAGIVGIVIGFAAQKSIGTFFAGLQIAISQPIRIDDTVVVEDQFGTIGEINLTYVIVNSWDGRRLVVPISYFLEKPFENWTRMSPEIISKVKFHADYSLPVDRVREELGKLLGTTPLWDKRRWNLLIVNANDKTIEVRASMSAKDSDDAFDLECYIREKLIEFIKNKYPHCLPTTRLKVVDSENTHN
jgi:small-conductance mechanosensitive channel